jgi:Putative phage abortive infection protein
MSRFWHRWRVELFIALGGLIAINLIFFARAFRETHTIDRQSAGELGDFVGGYVGTFFTLLGVVLVVRTLRSQVEASEKEHFETKYFELVKMHRDNVAEVDLQGATGRKVFVLMVRELRCALEVVRRIAAQLNQKLDQRELLKIAYYCLFFGVGPNSSRMLKMSLSGFDPGFVDAVERELNNEGTKMNFQEDRGFGYVPFEGHQSRLGHYYRHLYQMVGYVDQQRIEIRKYEYVKTIRAQLSTHEQALLLINSLTEMGHDWWDKGFIVTYRLVQNIPHDFFDKTTELDTRTLFDPGYFEWEDAGPARM